MGSAKVKNNVDNTIPMAENKKSFTKILIKPIQALFNKKKDKDAESKGQKKTNAAKPQEKQQKTQVDKVIEDLNKLDIQEDDEFKQFTIKQVEEEDDIGNFTVNVIEETQDRRQDRIDSHSSEDSGFSEKCDPEKNETEQPEAEDGEREAEDKDVVEALGNLKIEDGKPKKLQKVVLSRGPVKTKGDYVDSIFADPYERKADNYRQINQINKHALSGGQVTVASKSFSSPLTEVDIALRSVELTSSLNPPDSNDWEIIEELIQESKINAEETSYNFVNPHDGIILHDDIVNPLDIPNPHDDDILKEFDIEAALQNNEDLVDSITELIQNELAKELNAVNQLPDSDQCEQLDNLMYGFDEESFPRNQYPSIFPTPPRSENVPSPMSEASYAPSHSDYTLSPAMPSPAMPSPQNDYEVFQEIAQYEFPNCVAEILDREETVEKKPRERKSSASSMTLKQFKDLQKELANGFSKKECCQLNRKSCKQIFQEHIQKLKMEERKSLCSKVANLDLKTAYGVLSHVLMSLARGSENEDLGLALFSLICERVLAQQPALFVDEFGLSLIKAAAMRCYKRPILTRYLVQCVRTALRADAALLAGKEVVFHEVDAQGDTLVSACARAGDSHADVLAELVRRDAREPALFDVHHGNAEGYSALHVACRQHSAASPALHAAHVLLEHAGADLWRGDVKGGDTALHLAVNSPTCSLQLVMVMFWHEHRQQWKKLAHCPNRSSVTPLEYARCATKSTTRQNYPTEVLEFLKKCR